jgi:hypothetical protein
MRCAVRCASVGGQRIRLPHPALRGKTRAQVRRLLGRPDNGFVRSRHWEYMTGPQRGVPIDVEYLDVTFVSRTVRYVAFSNE